VKRAQGRSLRLGRVLAAHPDGSNVFNGFWDVDRRFPNRGPRGSATHRCSDGNHLPVHLEDSRSGPHHRRAKHGTLDYRRLVAVPAWRATPAARSRKDPARVPSPTSATSMKSRLWSPSSNSRRGSRAMRCGDAKIAAAPVWDCSSTVRPVDVEEAQCPHRYPIGTAHRETQHFLVSFCLWHRQVPGEAVWTPASRSASEPHRASSGWDPIASSRIPRLRCSRQHLDVGPSQ
jgi:hypothetical protein